MLWLLIFILFIETCFGLSNSTYLENRIVKGWKVDIYQYPHSGFLYFKKDLPTACGSSLILAQAVITAAHCLDELKYHAGKINVFFGSKIPITSQIIRNVVAFRIHPKYKPEKGTFNLGIAFLNYQVPLGDGVRKIPIVTTPPKVNDALYTSGWGKQVPDKHPDYSNSRHLKVTKQRVISLQECQKYVGFQMSEAFWCTASINGFHYHGDAGNGLVTKDKFLVAVVSFMVNDVTIYTDVAQQIRWVEKAVYSLRREYCGKTEKNIVKQLEVK